MPDNLVFNHDDGIAKGWRESVYTEPCLKDSLSAEILKVAKLRESLSTKFQTVFKTTSSSSNLSDGLKGLVEERQKTNLHSENWDIKAWIPKSNYQLELPSRVGSGPISRKRKRSIAEIITNIRTSTDLSLAELLAARLEYLVAVSEEEFPDQEPLSPRSLEDFLNFVRSVQDIAYPDIVLSYEGHLRAEWTKSRNKHFAVEFLGANEVRFVVFAPDPKKPYNTNRCSGLSMLDSLMELVRPFGVFDWVVDPVKTAA